MAIYVIIFLVTNTCESISTVVVAVDELLVLFALDAVVGWMGGKWNGLSSFWHGVLIGVMNGGRNIKSWGKKE